MRIRYPDAITESEEDLIQSQQQTRGKKTAYHFQMLRLLKSGQAKNLGEAAALMGDSKTQVTRWWAAYRAGGVAALRHEPHYPGRPPHLTPEAREGLHAAMRRGEIATVQDARREQWHIEYHSINGIWWQLRQERTRKKTGRPRHRQASAKQQQAFKKTLRAS
jgi:transposase